MITDLPDHPITAIDPISKAEFDVRPLVSLLYNRYNGDKEQLVGELMQLSNYLMRDPEQQDSAQKLRHMFNLVADITTAVDSVRIVTAA